MKENNNKFLRLLCLFLIFLLLISTSISANANPLAFLRLFESIESFRSLSSIRLFESMPKTISGLEQIYKASVTAQQLARITKATSELNTVSNRVYHWHEESEFEQFWEMDSNLDQGTSNVPLNYLKLENFDIIIGHSKGEYLYLGGEGYINYEKLRKISGQKGNILIVISCESAKNLTDDAIGMKRKITYPTAVKIAKRIVNKLELLNRNSQGYISMHRDEVISLIRDYTRTTEDYYFFKSHCAKIITIGGITIAYIIVERSNEEDIPKPKIEPPIESSISFFHDAQQRVWQDTMELKDLILNFKYEI